MKILHSICQQVWKTQQWPQDWKRSVFIPIPKKGNAKECGNYCIVALILSTLRLCSKFSILKKKIPSRLQEYMSLELPDVQNRFRKGRETRDQNANIHQITEKARKFQKACTSSSLTVLKPLTVWMTINYGKFLKRWEYLTTLPVS